MALVYVKVPQTPNKIFFSVTGGKKVWVSLVSHMSIFLCFKGKTMPLYPKNEGRWRIDVRR